MLPAASTVDDDLATADPPPLPSWVGDGDGDASLWKPSADVFPLLILSASLSCTPHDTAADVTATPRAHGTHRSRADSVP
jgi:hypothetical protein